MSDLDTAEQWAQANPNHPQAKAVLAKAWAMKNPNDPRASQIMAKIGQAAQQAQNPQTIPDAGDKAAQNNNPQAKGISTQPDSPLMNYVKKGVQTYGSYMGGVVSGGIKNLSLGNFDPLPKLREGSTAARIGGGVGQVVGGAEAGMGLVAALPEAAASTALGRIGSNAAIGAIQGGLAKPEEGQTRLGNATVGGLVGGGASSALEGGSAILGKLGDYLMQKGVGIRNYNPGAGTKLADQGVIGTRGMISKQVEDKLPGAEEEVQKVVSSLEGSAPASEISNAVSAKGTKFVNPDTGLPFEGKETSYNQVRDIADKIGQRESYSPGALLKLKRASDYEGYTASGNPATSLKAEIEQAQADKARELLSKMSGGASAEALSNEQALILANKALNKPEKIHQGMGSSMFFGKYPGQSILGTSLGQAGVKGSQAIDAVADPAVLQSLFGAANSSQK